MLGTAVAALASSAGLGVLVTRLRDHAVPRADTLRNQGWLQSGIMYPVSQFNGRDQYERFATQTFFAGRQMLRQCGIPIHEGNGILGVRDRARTDDLVDKSALLRFSKDEFRRLETDEVVTKLGELADDGMSYFHIPDVPFDEAGVLTYLREEAKRCGTEFIQVDEPVTLQRSNEIVRICCGEEIFESPLTLVTAGSGSFDLVDQVGGKLEGELRRTPLLVSDRPGCLPPGVFVDLERGFSAVRHPCAGLADGAAVVGTKARSQPAPRVAADERHIPLEEEQEFVKCLPPVLASRLLPARYTAGYEVIPRRVGGPTAYEPWIEDCGSVVFASPGRATVALMAANLTLARLLEKRSLTKPKSFNLPSTGRINWAEPITMHFSPDYDFDDSGRTK